MDNFSPEWRSLARLNNESGGTFKATRSITGHIVEICRLHFQRNQAEGSIQDFSCNQQRTQGFHPRRGELSKLSKKYRFWIYLSLGKKVHRSPLSRKRKDSILGDDHLSISKHTTNLMFLAETTNSTLR